MNDPVLLVMVGLPGVGKSTVAEDFADEHDADIIRSDVVRKEMFSEPNYTSAETQKMYDEMLARAGERLEAGDSVVVDATFTRASLRSQAAGVAEATDASVQFIYVKCQEEVAKERLRTRGDGPSDATPGVYDTVKRQFEPLTRTHLVVNNTKDDPTLAD